MDFVTGKIVWVKRGGFADVTMKPFFARAKEAGFAIVDASQGGTPDGSTVGSGLVWKDDEGNTIRTTSSYGVTMGDNRFRIEFTAAPK